MSEPPTRDHVTAGLEFARVVLSGAVSSADAVAVVRRFHTRVVLPLLNDEVAEKDDLLAWARFRDGASLLSELSDLDNDEWAALEDVRFDLLSLAEQLTNTTPTRRSSAENGPQILARTPDGRWTTLTAHAPNGDEWDTPCVKTAQVEKALHSVLGQFSLIWPTAWNEEEDQPTHLCWPSDIELGTAGATLPIALWHLGRLTGLGTPPVLVVGEMADGRYLRDSSTIFGEKPEKSVIATLFDAMKADGRNLLVPVDNRWRWLRPEEQNPEAQDVTVVRPMTLDDAAHLVWGEAWDRWKVEHHRAEIPSKGWSLVDCTTPPGQPLPDIEVIQSFQLTRLFVEEAQRITAVLGGTRRSGKSCIVRCVVRELTGRKPPWNVVVLTEPSAKLPDQAIAASIAKHALGAAGMTSAKRLVVFEGLRPHDDAESHVGSLLRHVAAEAEASVLAVLEYNDNSRAEWDVSGATVITAPVGKAARERFIDDLIDKNPALKPGEARAHEAAAALADLRQLTQLLNSDDPFARIEARFGEMANTERKVVLTAAAMSLVGGVVAGSTLEALDADDHEIFGVIPGRWPETFALTGYRDCISLIDLYAAERPATGTAADRNGEHAALRHQVLTELVEPELRVLLESTDPELAPRVPALFSGIWLFNQKLAKNLAAQAFDDGLLTSWASTTPAETVSNLLAIRHLFDDNALPELTAQLVKKLPDEPPWRPGSVMMLVRTVKNIDSSLREDTLREIATWLKDQVEHLMDSRQGSPEELCDLMEALARYDWRSAEIKPFVADRALDVLSGVRHDRLGDYRAVRRVVDLLRMLRGREEVNLSALLVEHEYDVQAMLQREPKEHDGIQVLFASINLRQTFDWVDYEVRFQPFQVPMTAALGHASATDLTTAINDLRRSNPRLATAVIGHGWPEFPDAVRRLLHRAWPADAAALIRAIANTNSLQLPHILLKEGAVDQRLITRLAKQIVVLRDTSSTGMLLSALHFADDLFHRGQEMVATALAEEVGEDAVQNLIKHDPRMSSLYYLIKGVWDAEASYREQVLGTVVEVVADHVKRRRQHWGPLAALRLLADAEMGELALQRLRTHLTPADLVKGMFTGNTAQARAALHRLGRVMYPTVATMYRDQWDEVSFIDGLRTKTSALEVCAEATRTLAEADVPGAGRTMLLVTGGVDEWFARLFSGGRPHLFATQISQLTTLDHDSARQVLDLLRAAPTRTKIRGQTVRALASWLRKAMLDDATTTAAVIQACEDVQPGLSKELVDELAEDGYAAHVLRWSAAYNQNPISQSHAARTLIRAGLTLQGPQSRWIDAVHEARMDTLNQFTSPQACAAILHMFAAWNEQWAIDAAISLDVTRMARRVRQGRVADLPGVIDLIRTLDVCGGTASARMVAEHLHKTDLSSIGRHVDLQNLCQLADVMELVLPDAVPKVLTSIQVAVDAAITNTVVLDESKVWRNVARACATARRLRTRIGPFTDPEVRPNLVHAPAVAWVAAELGDPAWGEKAAERMRVRLNDRDFPSPADQGYVLFATKNGWAPELRPADKIWSAGLAPMWLLRMLSQESTDDPYLTAVLKTAAPVIRKRMVDPARRSDWDAKVLSNVINALAPRQSMQDVISKLRTPPTSRDK